MKTNKLVMLVANSGRLQYGLFFINTDCNSNAALQITLLVKHNIISNKVHYFSGSVTGRGTWAAIIGYVISLTKNFPVYSSGWRP